MSSGARSGDGVVIGKIPGAFNAPGLTFTTISGQPTLLFSNTRNGTILKAGPGDIVPARRVDSRSQPGHEAKPLTQGKARSGGPSVYRHPSPAAAFERGDVVLLHDDDHYGAHESWRATAAALPLIVDRIVAAGLQPASVTSEPAPKELALTA